MTASQSSLIRDLMNLLLPYAGAQVIPFATRLAQEFNQTQSLVDEVEHTLYAVGTMAANNLQGEETRRAQDEHQGGYQYAGFRWQPLGEGDETQKLQNIVNGLYALGVSVTQGAPPLPEVTDRGRLPLVDPVPEHVAA